MNDIDYRTTDILLAACLILKGYDLKTIDVIGQKGTFVFTDIPHEMVEQYDFGKLTVEPRDFNNQIKNLTTSVRRMTAARNLV